ncbi:hypothetical protein AAG747_25220 [Rapidithrix thailandica]|uniref:Carboxypeptidase regulatory-like domain-containing protein n=1 Tax=Rapidithrix thailandica TaxID=413964 RepID=A0AAW9SE81_9BACT
MRQIFKLYCPHKRLFYWAILLLLVSSCISRLARPEITGVIVDYQKKPIANCTVGEVKTNAKGEFCLPEQRYNKFFLTEIFQMEAPPIFVSEDIEKEGYISERIKFFDRYGGGAPKGTQYPMDTIVLNKTNQHFDIPKLLSDTWEMSANKQLDTLYLIKKDFFETCKTHRCGEFYQLHSIHRDQYYHSGKLPEGILSRHYLLHFQTQGSLEIQKILHYDHRVTDAGSNRGNDTLSVTGKWQFPDKRTVVFDSSLPELNTSYKIATLDFSYIMLAKSTVKEPVVEK